jgi:hypothetical protein
VAVEETYSGVWDERLELINSLYIPAQQQNRGLSGATTLRCLTFLPMFCPCVNDGNGMRLLRRQLHCGV